MARRCSPLLGSARLGWARTMRRAAACLRALCLLLQLRASGEQGRPRAARGAAAHLLWRGHGWRRAGGLARAFQHRGQRSPGPGSGGAGTASTREESDAFLSFYPLFSAFLFFGGGGRCDSPWLAEAGLWGRAISAEAAVASGRRR